jgi:subtilase family serine protease
VTKVEVDDPVVAEIETNVFVTVRNTGDADADPFFVAVLETNLGDGVHTSSDSFAVPGGIAAGKSKEVMVLLAIPKDGQWKLEATADSDDTVAESDEGDNSGATTVEVLASLPDIEWVANGFTILPADFAPGHYEITTKIKNSGTEAVREVFYISFTWYRDEDSASGELVPMPIASDMNAGDQFELSKLDDFPGPGTYTIYGYIDRDGVVDELNEDNNEASTKLTVP